MPDTRTPNRSWTGSLPVPLIVVAALLIVVGGGIWMWNRTHPESTQGPSLTPEAKAYVRNLRLTDVEMSAHESYLKQRVVQIVGKIGNAGDRPLDRIEIFCIFYDPYGQVVLRERVPIVGGRTGGLKPGETKNFRLAFDNLPDSWNQAMPQLVIAHIQFD